MKFSKWLISIDDAASSYGRKLQGDLEEREWVKLKQVEVTLKKVGDV